MMRQAYCRDCGTVGQPRRRGSDLIECLLALPAAALFVLTMLVGPMAEFYSRAGNVRFAGLPTATSDGLFSSAAYLIIPAVLYFAWRRVARRVCPACRGNAIPADSPIARAEILLAANVKQTVPFLQVVAAKARERAAERAELQR